jgi:uncharacterized membrane protein (DUF4010 family)
MLEKLQPFALALVIGLLIGIERERSIPKGVQAVGMRTFVLYALIGVVVAEIANIMLALTASMFVFLSLLLTYYRSTRESLKIKELGITTEVAAGLVFLLGFLAKSKPILSLSIGIITLVLLLGRRSLHQFARDKINTKELQATVTILIISLGIITFLPNKTIDPWNLFNPQHFGFIILALALIQFGSYVCIRIFGENLGMMLSGFFGGLISSTAVFANLSSAKGAASKQLYPRVCAATFAVIGTMVEFIAVIFLVSPKLALNALPSIALMVLIGASSALFMMHEKSKSKLIEKSANPLDLKSILRLACLLFGVLFIISLAKRFIGEQAIYPLSFITGLFELQAIAYAIATLYLQAQLELKQALELLMLCVVSSFLSKFVLMWAIARNRFALITTLIMILMLVCAAVLLVFQYHIIT